MPKSTNPLARRKSAPSPVSTSKRSKSRLSSGADSTSERLDDTGAIPSLTPRAISQDVKTLIRYIHAHTWEDIPDRASGMGSERISEILRFRETLPRIVSLAHLHALSASTTATERELARMTARGAVRKVVIPGRGKGGAAVGEGVVLAEDWKTSVRECVGVGDEVKEKYITLLDSNPGSATASIASLADEEVRELVSAGYFTSHTALSSNLSNLFAAPGTSSLSNLALAGTKAATGTLAAIGGYGAVQESGGGGSTLATSASRIPNSSNKKSMTGREMTFSLPSTGAYLKLLLAARHHLLSLLKQISPRFKEATYDFLKEKWEGNIPNDAASRAKRARGEWSGVLPGKTRKWKEFYGLRFEWVLAECVGSGVVEVFETGIGVWGVRAV